MSDHNLVSQEIREVNYILQQHGFKQSEYERSVIITRLGNFKKNHQHTIHNRISFY